jgi:phosphoglycerate dehydrogenase-like enzyme
LKPEHRDLIQRLEPRLELVADDSLLPPMRWPADFQGDPAFSRSAAQQRRFDALLDSADALYGIPDVDPAALARTVRANPRLRWVQVMAAGGGAQVKAAGLSAAELARVAFTTSAGVHAGPLAEFALFGLLAGAKRLPRLAADQAARRWPGRWSMGQLASARLAVVGLGHIGREVARLAAAFGAEVTGVDLRAETAEGVTRVLAPTEVAEAARGADGIVNTLPGTESTHHLIDAAVIGALAEGATLVSVGRGSVVDQAALTVALISGQVGFAALDVFEREPLPGSSPLWAMDNVIVSPHTAANSPGEERAIAEIFADNATRFLDGRELRNRVDTVQFF